jgi:sialate O-acetylesterase
MTRNQFVTLAIAVFLACSGGLLWADVTLSKLFGDGMVLQRDKPVPVWGWAEPGEAVNVIFAGQTQRAVADGAGKWRVALDPLKASKTGTDLTVKGAGTNTVSIRDVLVGEVWLCSGQSNMEMPMGQVPDLEPEAAAATNLLIRHRKIENRESPILLEDVPGGSWVACVQPNTFKKATATGYYFARELARELDVPVGLINCSWGGTPIETWTAPAGFEAVAELKDIIPKYEVWDSKTELGQKAYGEYLPKFREWLNGAEKALAARQPIPPPPARFPPPAGNFPALPTRLFNSMIHPLMPCAIRGVIWYQGESNGGEGLSYVHKTRALVGGWRQLWKQGDFPFYWVQLPAYGKSDPNPPAGGNAGDGWAHTREAQRRALAAITNTGMAVLIDLGEADNLHPKNKQDVGLRLARWALAKDYGKPMVHSGPLYRSFEVEGNRIRVHFDQVGRGLMIGSKAGLDPVVEVKNGKLARFAVAGEVETAAKEGGPSVKKRVWHWADAVIDDDTVVVSCQEVPQPVAVRYAYANNPEGANLYNKEGLPASPFRTDEWDPVTGK